MEDKIIDIIEQVSEYKGIRNNIEIDLLDNNILDSLAFVELIAALEDEFNIELQPTQIEPNIWRKVSSIINLIKEMKQ